MKLRLPRLTIGMRAGLTIGIGGLVLLAVVTVLFLGFGSARRNTQDLLLGNARIALQLIQNGIHAELRPVERQVGFVGTFMEAENPGQPIETDVVTVWRIVAGRIAEVWDIPSVYASRPQTQQ